MNFATLLFSCLFLQTFFKTACIVKSSTYTCTLKAEKNVQSCHCGDALLKGNMYNLGTNMYTIWTNMYF